MQLNLRKLANLLGSYYVGGLEGTYLKGQQTKLDEENAFQRTLQANADLRATAAADRDAENSTAYLQSLRDTADDRAFNRMVDTIGLQEKGFDANGNYVGVPYRVAPEGSRNTVRALLTSLAGIDPSYKTFFEQYLTPNAQGVALIDTLSEADLATVEKAANLAWANFLATQKGVDVKTAGGSGGYSYNDLTSPAPPATYSAATAGSATPPATTPALPSAPASYMAALQQRTGEGANLGDLASTAGTPVAPPTIPATPVAPAPAPAPEAPAAPTAPAVPVFDWIVTNSGNKAGSQNINLSANQAVALLKMMPAAKAKYGWGDADVQVYETKLREIAGPAAKGIPPIASATAPAPAPQPAPATATAPAALPAGPTGGMPSGVSMPAIPGVPYDLEVLTSEVNKAKNLPPEQAISAFNAWKGIAGMYPEAPIHPVPIIDPVTRKADFLRDEQGYILTYDKATADSLTSTYADLTKKGVPQEGVPVNITGWSWDPKKFQGTAEPWIVNGQQYGWTGTIIKRNDKDSLPAGVYGMDDAPQYLFDSARGGYRVMRPSTQTQTEKANTWKEQEEDDRRADSSLAATWANVSLRRAEVSISQARLEQDLKTAPLQTINSMSSFIQNNQAIAKELHDTYYTWVPPSGGKSGHYVFTPSAGPLNQQQVDARLKALQTSLDTVMPIYNRAATQYGNLVPGGNTSGNTGTTNTGVSNYVRDWTAPVYGAGWPTKSDRSGSVNLQGFLDTMTAGRGKQVIDDVYTLLGNAQKAHPTWTVAETYRNIIYSLGQKYHVSTKGWI